MVDHASLLKDLTKEVARLETDLRERSEDPTAVDERTGRPFPKELRAEYDKAWDAERTAATYETWRDERITQAAAAWALGTVFVRFCEDNGLLAQPFLSGTRAGDRYDIAQERKDAFVAEDRSRTDRDWLVHAFHALGVSPVTQALFDERHNPMWSITPSHQAAKELLEFWRARGDDGEIVHDFTDPTWDTRFLGDLYQDLSENARKNYALLQTPEFVEEFILDHTLEPAIEEFGLHGDRIYQPDSTGFRLIDPACGSGHFLLGAFHRLLEKWRDEAPQLHEWERINRALRSVHGVDKNPFAVAIARFRLLLAAMREGGITELSSTNPDWPLIVATGDSLLHGRGASGVTEDLFASAQSHVYAFEDVHDERFREADLLGVASYHAVVGNPPYITVKDRQENRNYRAGYSACSGTYALSVPFAQRFFQLAKRVGGLRPGAGYVGQITANSFMKREFGKKLIQEFFREEVRLTHVIDTSGAYIPGHGTPTVILIGRNHKNTKAEETTVRTVLGIRGEPTEPENPADGHVWRAIRDQLDRPGSESEWVSVTDTPWLDFGKHPWNLAGGGALDALRIVESTGRKLTEVIDPPIGRAIRAGADEAYMRPRRTTLTTVANRTALRPLMIGEVVRDWGAWPEDAIWYPYNADLQISQLERELWPFRTLLAARRTFQGDMRDAGLQWWDYMQHTASAYTTPLSIAFAFVATHNHFVLDRGGKVFNRSAPVIKLPEGATEEEHLELLGVLNSSTACFWLKQVCHDKGNGGIGGGIANEEWERFFEFTGTKLQEFPLPSSLPGDRARELDELAQHLSDLEPAAVVREATPTRERLAEARAEHAATRARMVALQEELDWDVYHRYGLLSEEEHAEVTMPDTADVPAVEPGQRAFEIVLARRIEAGEVQTEWFHRHGTTPTTEVPGHWPEPYRRVVARRIELIEARPKSVGLLERPEHKRRWQAEPWERKEREALRSWLLDRCEDRSLWYAPSEQGEVPRVQSTRRLANRLRTADPDTVAVAELYDPDRDFAAVIADIVADQHVPHLAQLRYKPSGLRKRRQWEHVWELQRQEDAQNAARAEGEPERRLDIPVPPGYKSADFARPSYWANRGKLDVPKERFISYPGAETAEDGSLVLGWAGWNHAEQADACVDLALDRADGHGWQRAEILPLVAGLAELMPWVRQWHSEPDRYSQNPAEDLAADLADLRSRFGLTDSDLTEWWPHPAGRGRKAT